MEEFWLYKRAEHVYSEAFRVHQFKRICDGEHTDNTLTKLGLLMDGSHWSCSKGNATCLFTFYGCFINFKYGTVFVVFWKSFF